MTTIDLREINERHRKEFWERDMKRDYRLKQQFLNDIEMSYKLMTGPSIAKYLSIARNPDDGVRRLRVLEIGYGMGFGLRKLVDWLHVDPRGIVGIECLPVHHEGASRAFPDSKFFLVDGNPETLPKVLNEWADAGIKFDFIMARHVMEHHPEPQPVLRAVYRLLKATPQPSSRYHGVYCQVTPPPEDDKEKAHLTNLNFIKAGASWVPGGWPEQFTKAGLHFFRYTKPVMPAHNHFSEHCAYLARGEDVSAV